jgi:transcriptional regulator with XRE-family HTH domain
VPRPSQPPPIGRPATAAGDDTTNADALRRLGQRVRTRRQALGYTLRDVAGLTGLSTPFLSQVENGVGTPSLTSLFSLARVLETTPEALLAGPQLEQVSVIRRTAGARFPVVDGAEGAIRRQLTGSGEPFSAAEYIVEPGTDLGEFEASPGRDLLHVTEGALTVEVRLGAGVVTHDLAQGDTILYHTSDPHRWSVSVTQRTRFLHLVSTPL